MIHTREERQGNMRKALAVLVLAILFVCAIGPGEGQVGEEGKLILKETRITNDSYIQTQPDIYGDNIVWTDFKEGGKKIFNYNIESGLEKRLTNGSGHFPTIGQKYAIWQGTTDDGNGSLSGYNFETERSFITIGTDFSNARTRPKIYNDFIVYIKSNFTDSGVYMYDILNRTELPISTNPARKSNPLIWNNWIVWNDFRNGDWDVYGYNLISGQETIIIQGLGDQSLEFLWGDNLFWGEPYKGYIYNLSTKTQKELPSYAYQAMWNDYIVCGNPNGTCIYEISDENAFLLSKEIYEDHAIWENRVVYIESNDIYLLEFSFPQSPEPTFWEQNRMPIGLGFTFLVIALVVAFVLRSGKKSPKT